jgi:putative aldouronate transport system substrate-binding protein
MKHVLRRAGLVLAILVVVAGFAIAEASSESSAKAEPLNIRLFGVRGFPGEGTPIQGMLEDLISKKMGYPVTFELFGGGPDSDLHPVVDMMLASNELPDVFQRFNIDPEFLEQAATTFSVAEYKANMPRQAKRLTEIMNQLGKDEDDTWAIYQNDEGNMWGAPRIWEWGWIPSGQMWRKDIVEELGYDIPSTLAEAEEIFEAFKAVYPDEYALTGRGQTDWQCFDLVFNAFGFSMLSGTTERDGKVVQVFTTREFREALQVLRRWYEKGYWDPDFVNQGLEWMTNFAEGKYIVTQWTKDWNFPTGQDTRYLNNLRDNVPGAMAVAARHLAAD